MNPSVGTKPDPAVLGKNNVQRQNAAGTPSPALDLRRKSRSMSKADEALQLPRPPAPNAGAPDAGPHQPQLLIQEPPKSRRGSIYEPVAKPAERRASLKPLPREIPVPNLADAGAQPKATVPRPVNKEHSHLYLTAPPAPPPPQWPEDRRRLPPSYMRESANEPNVGKPCAVGVVVLLITLTVLLIMFLLMSSESPSDIHSSITTTTPSTKVTRILKETVATEGVSPNSDDITSLAAADASADGSDNGVSATLTTSLMEESVEND
ncbi:uncharacterized protein LOC144123129 [Amblyomma americanum]